MGSPENCTVSKLYDKRTRLNTQDDTRKYFFEFYRSGFQPFLCASILTDMVDHSTSRFNTSRQWGLIIAIVAVGLLDVAVNSYLSNEEIVSLRPTLPSTIHAIDQPDVSQTPLAPLPDQIETFAPPTTSGNTVRRYAAAVKIDRRARMNKTAVPMVANLREPAANCQTVTYPFVGEYFVVRVTDGTGCFNSVTASYRADRLVAKSFAPRPIRKLIFR
jgi:hypothetical protein